MKRVLLGLMVATVAIPAAAFDSNKYAGTTPAISRFSGSKINLAKVNDSDDDFFLHGVATEFAEDFNATAAKLKVSLRFKKVSCKSGPVLSACQYTSGASTAAAVFGKNSNDGQTDNVTLIYSGDKAGFTNFIVMIGITMAMYAPDTSKEERGAAMAVLLKDLASTQKGEVELSATRFRILFNGAYMVTITDARAGE